MTQQRKQLISQYLNQPNKSQPNKNKALTLSNQVALNSQTKMQQYLKLIVFLQDHQPKEHQPKDHQPKDHQPKDHQPKDHQPKDHQPKEHQPKDHQPKDHQPKDPFSQLQKSCSFPNNSRKESADILFQLLTNRQIEELQDKQWFIGQQKTQRWVQILLCFKQLKVRTFSFYKYPQTFQSSKILKQVSRIKFTHLRQLVFSRVNLNNVQNLSFQDAPHLSTIALNFNDLVSIDTFRKMNLKSIKYLKVQYNRLKQLSPHRFMFSKQHQYQFRVIYFSQYQQRKCLFGNIIFLLKFNPISIGWSKICSFIRHYPNNAMVILQEKLKLIKQQKTTCFNVLKLWIKIFDHPQVCYFQYSTKTALFKYTRGYREKLQINIFPNLS